MRNSLLFDFSVIKENNIIEVKREFTASLELVWDAWTKPKLLDLWWAPKPWQTKTRSMDFRAGGFWLYAMTSLTDQKHWCRADYQKIESQTSFSHLDSFCDENGNINQEFPRSQWRNVFNQNADTTTVSVSIKYETLIDLEKIIAMGFKEGFTMGLQNLDELLETLSKQTKI
ncbi:MAG: SRPBCC domain-containing protein [Chitinophagaceae bacterium]|nr:SRPBCC domain-containing protein [Chitinophagaceae bacterium]